MTDVPLRSKKYLTYANVKLYGILTGLTSCIMKKYELPKRIIAEITITNVSKYHEGRIDAILEYSGNQYGFVVYRASSSPDLAYRKSLVIKREKGCTKSANRRFAKNHI
jgi:hypothetical protein